jgi:hypothetical protein
LNCLIAFGLLLRLRLRNGLGWCHLRGSFGRRISFIEDTFSQAHDTMEGCVVSKT